MGRTPLCIATQNGNLAMIKFLISKGADPLINSNVSSTEEESNLLVAARWKHQKIVEFYLEFCKWPYRELKKARNAAENAIIRKIIIERMKIIHPKVGCFSCIGH